MNIDDIKLQLYVDGELGQKNFKKLKDLYKKIHQLKRKLKNIDN